MKKKRRFFYTFLLIFILIFSLPVLMAGYDIFNQNLDKEAVKGDLGKKLDEYFTRITPFGFSGALLVAKDGEILLNKGYGLAIRSQNIPNTAETVFSTGSITKQFTAAGIMKLEMMGKLNTSDLITKYFEKVPEAKKNITLHHLLTHTSGVVDMVGPDYRKAPRDETCQKILQEPLQFRPGDEFAYSNAGYSLLAAVIEKVSGKSYEEFLNENLFKPAGMNYTGYRRPEWDKKVVAHWYRGERDNGTPLEKPYPYWNLLGNGGILSTTSDMLRWHRALLEDKVLSQAAKKKIFTPYLNDYGYGWDVLNDERGLLIQHDGGSMLGSSAEVRRYLDAGIVTILFCNQSYGRKALFEPIRDKLESLMFGGDVAVPPAVKPLEKQALQKYQGNYELEGGSKIEIDAGEDFLILKAAGQEAINALFGVEKTEAQYYKKLNKLSEDIFTAALRGDFDPFGKILFNREEREAAVRDLMEMRFRRYKERTGDLKKAISHVTMPVEFRGKEAAQTFIEIKDEKGSIFFGLYWLDNKNIGVSPVMGVTDMIVPFLLESQNTFAGFHLEMGKIFQLTFQMDDSNKVEALILQNKGLTKPAKKVKS